MKYQHYPHTKEAPVDFVPAPEPALPEVPEVLPIVVEKEHSTNQRVSDTRKHERTADGPTIWMFSMFGAFVLLPMTVMGATMISNANSADAIAGKLPALAQADGFISAKPVNLDLTSASRIVLQATDTCTISSVEVVTVDQQGNQSWGGNAVDITQYSITNSPKDAPATTDTFHNFAEFDSSGLKEKYCS